MSFYSAPQENDPDDLEIAMHAVRLHAFGPAENPLPRAAAHTAVETRATMGKTVLVP